jgi:hypothetical protein
MRTRWIILLAVLGVLVFGLVGASEPPPRHGSERDAATIELIESQNRTRLLEQRQLFPRSIGDDLHAQIKRESQRARGAIAIFLVICLALLFFLVLPLFERDKVAIEEPLGPDETHVHRV